MPGLLASSPLSILQFSIGFSGMKRRISVAFGSSRLGSNPRGQVAFVSHPVTTLQWFPGRLPRHHASVVSWYLLLVVYLDSTGCGLFWVWLSCFVNFCLFLDLKVGTFLSFCLWFTKFGVGISLGLDHFTFTVFVWVAVLTGLNLNWLHALVDSFSCFVLSGVAACFKFLFLFVVYRLKWSLCFSRFPYSQVDSLLSCYIWQDEYQCEDATSCYWCSEYGR